MSKIIDGLDLSVDRVTGDWVITGWRKGDGDIEKAGLYRDGCQWRASDGWERLRVTVPERLAVNAPTGGFDRLFWFAEYLDTHGSPS